MSLQYYTDWNSRDKETNDDNYLLENIQNYDDNDLLESLKDREDDDSEGNGFFGNYFEFLWKKDAPIGPSVFFKITLILQPLPHHRSLPRGCLHWV